ncbi:discoidin domain-containing protein [Candidatus Microgenomates bacterium]|nr:discoidin domain-containing protein [Candidatus Microgenomates bacterium]
MIKKFKDFIRKKKIFFLILLPLIIVLISYGQTLRMYFWQDDFALIFKLLHQAEPMGSFGSGIIGEGPYKYLVTPFVPFFPLLGKEPFGYFLIGFLSYLLVILVFYLFTKQLFKDKKSAYISTLIFASGYIGSEIMFRIINSWQTNIGLILALSSLTFFTRVVNEKNRKVIPYIISFLLFWSATEFIFIRSHSLVLPFLVIDVIFSLIPFSLKKIPTLILRQIPFWYIFYTKYLVSVPAGGSSFSIIIKSILSGKIEILTGLIATVGNAFIPDFYQSKIISLFPSKYNFVILFIFVLSGLLILKVLKSKLKMKIIFLVLMLFAFFLNKYFLGKNLFWYRDSHSLVSGAVGMYMSIITLVTSILVWKKEKILSVGLIIGYVIIVSQVFGYFIQYPNAIFITTHRYLSYASIGYAIFFASLILILWKNKIGPILLTFLIISNLVLGLTYQLRLVRDRSESTRQFYKSLLNFTPKIRKDAIFYFDIKNDSYRQTQFRDFFSVGSMPDSTALAMWYGVDRDEIKLTTDYDEFLFYLSKTKDVNNVYTYYYGDTGLVDTTENTRNALLGKTTVSYPQVFDLYKITANVNMDEAKNCGQTQVPPIFNKYLDFFEQRRNYYSKAKVNSLSQWKGQETEGAIDNDENTSWRGHRIFWLEHKHEELTIDLGEVRNIDKVYWINTTNILTPINYYILTSIDGKKWQIAKSIENGKEKGSNEAVIEQFVPHMARYVRFDIRKTLSDDSPAISEILVFGPSVSAEDISHTQIFEQSAHFLDIDENDKCTTTAAFRMFAPYLKLVLKVETDQGNIYSEAPLIGSGTRVYEFIVRPGGTLVKNIEVKDSTFGLSPKVLSIYQRSLSFDEIQKRGLVKQFSKN